MTFGTGVTASLTAPFIMTVGFILWDEKWKGSAFALNMYKCCTASVGFLIVVLATTGLSNNNNNNNRNHQDRSAFSLFTNTPVDVAGYLILSSILGILVGDWTWLQSLQLLGVRRVVIFDSIKPFLAAFMGWIILNEQLRAGAWPGLIMTVVGVLLVGFEGGQHPNDSDRDPRDSSTRNETANERDPSDFDNSGPCPMIQDKSEKTSTSTQSSLSFNSEVLRNEESGGGCQELPTEMTSNSVGLIAVEASDDQQLTSADFTGTTEIDPTSCTDFVNLLGPVEPITASRHINTIGTVPRTKQQLRLGYAMAILNVVFDTYGALLIKDYGERLTTWEINLIRFGFAGAAMLVMAIVMWFYDRHPWRSLITSSIVVTTTADIASTTTPWYQLPRSMDWNHWCYVSVGVLFVTFLTPTLSNYALFQISLALAVTLGSVGPIYALPLSYFLQGERPMLLSCLGALLAVGGIVLLAFEGSIND